MAGNRKFKWEENIVLALSCMGVYSIIMLLQLFIKSWNWDSTPTLSGIFLAIKLAASLMAIMFGYMGADKIKNDPSFFHCKNCRSECEELFLARLAYIAGYIGFFYYPVWILMQIKQMF